MGWFTRTRKKRYLEDTENVESDIRHVLEFLQYSVLDIKNLHDSLAQIKKLRAAERAEIDDKKQLKEIEQLIESWDKLLERWVMFDRDVDINGERIKRVSQVLREESEKLPVRDAIKSKTHTKDEWTFDW